MVLVWHTYGFFPFLNFVGKKIDKIYVLKTILHTDLWTRAIHLLQIEPSRSAETPNSLRDLNDMLTNHTSVISRLKSNSTPWYDQFFPPEAFNTFDEDI